MKYCILLLLVFTLSCKNDNKSKPDYKVFKSEDSSTNDEATIAYELMKAQCYTCHNPETAHDNRIAPPMIAVKMHYLKNNTTQKEFAKSLWDFVKKPKKSNSKMKGAVKQFGLMPYQAYNKSDIYTIANYMYTYKLEKPDWFDKHLKEKGREGYHQKGKSLKKQKRKGPKQKGMDIAMATKKELGKNLIKALNDKGPVHAVEFCNLKAMPITARKEKELNAKIDRVSDQPRNPKNKATAAEEVYINTFKQMLANNESPEPVIEKKNGKFHFYYPIVTNSMCLKCHGEVGKSTKPETYKTIKLKYPNDLAIGYEVNEVRGMWHIEFQKDKP